jgi:4-hydroxythreonine-4-phosphate dehydrogenase
MTKESEQYRPVIGITVGDLNGIGHEVIIKALSDVRILNYCQIAIYGAVSTLNYHRKVVEEGKNFAFQAIHNIDQLHPKKINLITCWEDNVKITLGQPNAENAQFAITSLEVAVRDAKMGKLDAIITAPIDKKSMQSQAFNFPGHTEYFESQFGSEALMFMVSDSLRIAMATGHLPLRKVSDAITPELLIRKINLIEKSLREDFAINVPRIAVLGLNPHAGENGLLGDEEKNIILPTIEKLKAEGRFVFGPFPADGYFATGMYHEFDATLSMYHDQGLIPFKMNQFESGVNFTAGLSIVRTSPDHGTAYNIVGKDIANGESMRSAIFRAIQIIQEHLKYI